MLLITYRKPPSCHDARSLSLSLFLVTFYIPRENKTIIFFNVHCSNIYLSMNFIFSVITFLSLLRLIVCVSGFFFHLLVSRERVDEWATKATQPSRLTTGHKLKRRQRRCAEQRMQVVGVARLVSTVPLFGHFTLPPPIGLHPRRPFSSFSYGRTCRKYISSGTVSRDIVTMERHDTQFRLESDGFLHALVCIR